MHITEFHRADEAEEHDRRERREARAREWCDDIHRWSDDTIALYARRKARKGEIMIAELIHGLSQLANRLENCEHDQFLTAEQAKALSGACGKIREAIEILRGHRERNESEVQW